MKLEIKNLTKAFGGLRAIDDVSLDFPSGSLSAVIDAYLGTEEHAA